MSRLKEMYKNEIMDAMTKKFGYKNVMEVPKLDKIVINVVERTIQKSIGKENKVSVFDYDGKKDKYEEAIDLTIENKIELGYTNYCFDLWLILHKEDYFDIVQNQHLS